MTMKKYGNAATYPIDLNDGRTLGSGEIVELDLELYPSEHDSARLAQGTLVEIPETEPVVEGNTPPDEEQGTDNRQHRGSKRGGSA